MPRSPLIVVALTLVLLAPHARAQGAEAWLEDLAFPTNMAFAPDGRLFFVEKATGEVRVASADGQLDPMPVVTLDVTSAGETGLLGIALDPRFAEGEPWIYLYLSDPTDGMNHLVRARLEGAAAGEPEPLLTTVPATNAYHNGGDLMFGPDGMLYVAVGEAHERERAQDPTDVGGKVLRLRSDGTPAPGNPIAEGHPAFTLGHRNSFGLCADPATGDIWETENGPDVDDEVNRLVGGGNYGWPVVTGRDPQGRFVDPVTVFPDTVALTGCAWWRGDLLVGSWNDGRVRRIDPASGDATEVFGFPEGVTDLQVGPDDALYIATGDAIWRAESPAGGSLGPSPMPPAGGDAPDRSRWITIAAAVVLAGGLIARVVAGRSLRSRDDGSR